MIFFCCEFSPGSTYLLWLGDMGKTQGSDIKRSYYYSMSNIYQKILHSLHFILKDPIPVVERTFDSPI